MKPQMQYGFTLYELLITVAIVAIVLAFGIPNLGDFSRNSRITATANDLHSSFMVARSEAARAKTNITICASANGSDCNAASFNDGWIIFVDTEPNVIRAGLNENVLRRHDRVHENIDITAANGATYFTFGANGLGQTVAAAGTPFSTAMICDDRGHGVAAGGNSAARRIVVTPLGRSVVIRDADLIAEAGGCP